MDGEYGALTNHEGNIRGQSYHNGRILPHMVTLQTFDDEENEAAPAIPTLHAPHRRANEPQPDNGMDLSAGSSQVQVASTHSTGRRDRDRDQTRKDRDFFWSLLNKPRGPSIAIPRSSSRPDIPLSLVSRASGHGSGLSLPLSLVSRPGHTAETRANETTNSTALVRRILAFRKCNRNMSAHRPTRVSSNMYPTASGTSSHVFSTPVAAAMATDVMELVRSRSRRLQPREEIPESARNALLNDSSAEEIPGSPSILSRTQPNTSGKLNATGPTFNVDDQSEDEADAPQASVLPPATRDADLDVDHDAVEVVAPRITPGMSLEEEVVEIDAEPETITVADVSSDNVQDGAGNALNEEKPNTSTNTEEAQQQPHGVKRKRESDDNEPHSVKDFNQSLLRLLECPVCLEWMEPPMSQCRRGHLVCGRCRARLASCPVCRTAFSSVRNRAMEGVAEMLRYPCRHGCGREVRLRRRTPHEASCGARRYRCPAPACADRAPLPHHDLARHFQSKHLPLVKIGRKHKFSLKVNAEQHDNWLIMALHELFHLRVDVDIRTWGVIVYVAYIGPKCMAKNYTYEVTCVGQHNSRKLVYTRGTHCDLESSSLNVSRQDCFHLTLDQALNFLRVKNKYCEPDKFLHFSVDINKLELDASRDDSDS